MNQSTAQVDKTNVYERSLSVHQVWRADSQAALDIELAAQASRYHPCAYGTSLKDIKFVNGKWQGVFYRSHTSD